MRDEGQTVSIAQLCRWFGVPRSTVLLPAAARRRRPRPPVVDAALVETHPAIIEAEPAAGLRMITARVRRASRGAPVNRKKIHRILKLNQWQVRQRPQGHRPRVQGWVSRATRPNERWAIDTTHLFCGRDGWCHLTAIIDCYDRTIVGLAAGALGHRRRRGRGARGGAAGAADRRTSPPLVLRSDNGLVFGAKAFVAVVRRYRPDAGVHHPLHARSRTG